MFHSHKLYTTQDGKKPDRVENRCDTCNVQVITQVDASGMGADNFENVMPPTRYYLNNHENSNLLPTHINWFMNGIPEERKQEAQEYVQKTVDNNSGDIELGFLGFLETYQALSEIIPEAFVILDLGCAYGFQQSFFRKHKGYVGIDVACEGKSFYPNVRFEKCNMEDIDLSLYDPAQTFVIMNMVTTNAPKKITDYFKNSFIYYNTAR